MYKDKKGFTLIELLVVIAIISLLSSVVFTATNVARAKARDTRKLADANQVKTALNSFNLEEEGMPGNYNCDGSYCSGGGGTFLAIEDINNPTDPQTASGQAYNRSMQDLVDAGVLGAIPHSPGGSPYAYYNYGITSLGAVFGTELETDTRRIHTRIAVATLYSTDMESGREVCETYSNSEDAGRVYYLYCDDIPNNEWCSHIASDPGNYPSPGSVTNNLAYVGEGWPQSEYCVPLAYSSVSPAPTLLCQNNVFEYCIIAP
ncbi:MAG: type II secretion system protein [Patescibacteria group bacterium]